MSRRRSASVLCAGLCSFRNSVLRRSHQVADALSAVTGIQHSPPGDDLPVVRSDDECPADYFPGSGKKF